MWRKILHLGLVSAFFLGAEKAVFAQADPANTAQTSTESAPASPIFNSPADAAAGKKPFTITASLREEYDDNIYTTKDDKIASFKTEFNPSILVDYPMDQSDFSARYTFGATYFENRPGNSFDFTHEFVARYTHAFSDRFNIDLREKFGYYTDPDITDGTGTLFRDGAFIDNLFTGQFSAQWTPIFGTVTTYSNNVVSYNDNTIANEENNVENTGEQDFNFAIFPTYTLVFGGIVDDVSYDDIARGYTSYTGNVGLDWQALPSLALGARGGATYTDGHSSSGGTSPYASATVNWKLGQKSTLTFDYTHSVVASDIVYSDGQVADRFTTSFLYDVTTNISTHLTGGFTHGEYGSELLTTGTIPNSFSEDVLGIDTGASYHFNQHFDVDMGYTLSNVSSDVAFREYTRNQVYVGVRGTY